MAASSENLAAVGAPRREASAVVSELRGRIAAMQGGPDLGTRIETLPAFASLLPGGALHAGAAYTVAGSMTLLMGLLAGPSAAGAWCGVVGVPEFGAEAASRFGIELSRLVLVPRPADSWLPVTAALADALTVVVVRPASRVREADAARLSSRLRQRGAALIAVTGSAGALGGPEPEWPGVEARLSIVQSSWQGIGLGHGYPSERLVTVVSALRGGRLRRAVLRLPGEREAVEQAARGVTDTVGARVGSLSPGAAASAAQRWEAVG